MFTVIITEKNGAEQRYDFDKPEVHIGRVRGNDIVLPKGNISKRHARIICRDDRFVVVDLNSTNGTYVNGRKITSPLVVKSTDKIFIGDFVLNVDGVPWTAGASPGGLGEPAGVTASGMPEPELQSQPPSPGFGTPQRIEPIPSSRPPAHQGGFSPGAPSPYRQPSIPAQPAMPVAPPVSGSPAYVPSFSNPQASADASSPPPVPGPSGMPAPGGASDLGVHRPYGAGDVAVHDQTARREQSLSYSRANLGLGSPPSRDAGAFSSPQRAPQPPAPQATGHTSPSPSSLQQPGLPQAPAVPSPQAAVAAPPTSAFGPSVTEAAHVAVQGARFAAPVAPPERAPARSPAADAQFSSSSEFELGRPTAVREAATRADEPSGRHRDAAARAVAAATNAAVNAVVPTFSEATSLERTGLSLGVAAASESPLLTALRAVMARVVTAVDLESIGTARGNADTDARQVDTAIDQAITALEREGSIDGSIDRANLRQRARREALGLGALEEILADPTVREVIVESPDRIVADAGEGLREVATGFSSSSAVMLAVRRLVEADGHKLDSSRAIVELMLGSGMQLMAILPQVAAGGPVVALRRRGKASLTGDELVSSGWLSSDMLQVIKSAVASRKNVLVSGPVGAGVSSLLGALGTFTGERERILIVQKSPNIDLRGRRAVSVTLRAGERAVPMKEILSQADWLRVERCIVDDVSGGDAYDVLETFATRKDGSFAGIHADSTQDALRRLQVLARVRAGDSTPDAIQALLAESFDLLVHVAITDGGARRVVSIAEVSGTSAKGLKTKDLFTYEGEFHATRNRPSFTAHAD